VRWRHTHSWGTSDDPDFVSQERRSSATTPSRPRGRRPSVPTNSGQSYRAPFLQRPAALPRATALKLRWITVAGLKRPGCMARCACAMVRN
jgi:hypothetical protein